MKTIITIEIDGGNVKIRDVKTEEVIGLEDTEKDVKSVNNDISIYGRVFDDTCKGGTKDPEFNRMFLKEQQRYANDMLKATGHLFLNDVYKMLGMLPSKAGQVVGWVYNENNPIGDNFIDFGLEHERNYDFINGYTNKAILDFNVDGNILDYI